MPNKQSAKKELRKIKKRAALNATVRGAYREAVKNVRKAIVAKQDAGELLRLAQKKLDKAAKRGVMKKNTASRKLSRLMKQAHGALKHA